MCDDRKALVPVEQLTEIARSNQATADQLRAITEQMAACLLQLDARLRRQEELMQRKVTIPHAKQKQLMAEIRHRAEEIAVKYRLPPESAKDVRAAIRKDIMAQHGIRDLHDLPESSLGAAMSAIVAWDSYSLIRRLRRELEGSDVR